VVIPCHNHAAFLADAIESVRAQTYTAYEIIVVDDGSTDSSAEVAAACSSVRLLPQRHSGVSAARNAGLAIADGVFVVFLDADDRLLPNALEVGVNCLIERPECGLVYGRYCLIDANGQVMSPAQGRSVDAQHYLAMLRSNYIGMHAAVMYRRNVLEEFGPFNNSLRACEDYDMYLRIMRLRPAYGHGILVAEYRQHQTNASRNDALMLKGALSVIRSQWTFVKSEPQARAAYCAGLRHWQDYFGSRVARALHRHVTARDWKNTIDAAWTLLRYHPRGFTRSSAELLQRAASAIARVASSKSLT